jgi:hypothetical protein
MKIKKNKLIEIIDSNNSLIGNDDIPTTGSDLESKSNKTTDYNRIIGNQPYSYDMLARFGFGLLPFYENKDNNQEKNNLLNELSELVYNKKIELLKYYYKNPNKLKNDYRIQSKKEFTDLNDNEKEENIQHALKIIELIQKYFDNMLSKSKMIDEDKVVEDRILKNEEKSKFLQKKSDNNEITDSKLKKIAGLINKLNKKDVNDLINLLEVK